MIKVKASAKILYDFMQDDIRYPMAYVHFLPRDLDLNFQCQKYNILISRKL